MQTKHPYLTIFFTFLKIGLFTFGGGYAMISLIEREFVAVKKWISAEEMMDMIAISESTPGPLAINSATYVGYRLKGFLGALLATLAVTIPSLAIIFAISLFLDQFLALTVVANAFKGVQVAVAVLIMTAGLNMLRQMKKDALSIAIFAATFVVMILIDAFAWRFSVIWLILIGGALGLCVYGVSALRAEAQRKRAALSATENISTRQTACDASEKNADGLCQTRLTPAGEQAENCIVEAPCASDTDDRPACGEDFASVSVKEESENGIVETKNSTGKTKNGTVGTMNGTGKTISVNAKLTERDHAPELKNGTETTTQAASNLSPAQDKERAE